MKLKQRVLSLVFLTVIFVLLYVMALLLSQEETQELSLAPPQSVRAESSSPHPQTVGSPSVEHSVSRQAGSQQAPIPVSEQAGSQQAQVFRNTSNIQLSRLRVSADVAKRDPWRIWGLWVTADYLYPEGVIQSEEMNHILGTMATAPITSFDVGHKGTQLKATAMLGGQRTVFKPKR